jgi:hypothetical protein
MSYFGKILENRELRRIFEPKREEVLEGWRRPYNKIRNASSCPCAFIFN